MMRPLYAWFPAICLLLVTSCGQKKEAALLLDEQVMGKVLFDMLQADAFSENFLHRDTLNKNKNTAVLQDQVFNLHHISREDFQNSYRYYSAKPKQMSRILDSVLALSERSRSNMMMERYSGSKAQVEPAAE
jgi:hypothetical protein